ncbi:dTDP-4-dehydrorhamnose reductase [Thioalkalivibrio sp. HK1]|uniref:dTDP-4-dehydrorhamnose reductase n=1 Tax=Thioalkalivibrio sp. HK1 TaxID=1469245 RepID=UPI00046FC72B|nr:dTDP-4-dehydrorhamnose reductase [Thioalkalivibrio sp. HK1]
MRVLLLGANGQLGHDILKAYQGRDRSDRACELIPLTRKDIDVSDPQGVDRVLESANFDTLINCTSYHKTDEVEDAKDLAFAINARSVKAMAEVCTRKNAAFFHISTDYVFGGDCERRRPLREDDPVAPVNVYGASKAEGERLTQIACEKSVILRVASLFGVAGASGKGGNFVETMIRLAREKGALTVVGDQIMSPTSTADIASVLIKMLFEGADPGIYHVVNRGAASWFEFAREIIRRAGIDATIESCTSEQYKTRAARPRYSVLDNARIEAAFGPMPDWSDALDRYLRAKGHSTSA